MLVQWALCIRDSTIGGPVWQSSQAERAVYSPLSISVPAFIRLFFVYAAQFLRPSSKTIQPAIAPQTGRNIF